jgi:hypothetical protein
MTGHAEAPAPIPNKIRTRTREGCSHAKSGGEHVGRPPSLRSPAAPRFGTITLVSIAIAILVPLYRFSEKLAAFYKARSDWLRLYQTPGYKSVGIVRLSTMLTPNIDYGKSQTVLNHLVEMLRLSERMEQDRRRRGYDGRCRYPRHR